MLSLNVSESNRMENGTEIKYQNEDMAKENNDLLVTSGQLLLINY